jgi:osmotically inducible protein OsmC
MPKRTSSAVWNGDLKGGKGTMRIGRTGYEGPFSFMSRFEQGTGTNPEELIAAAHAGCFSMALSGDLGAAGHAPRNVSTRAMVTIEKQGAGFKITQIELETEAEVPGIDEASFQKIAEGTRTGCPVSQALSAVPIKLKATLKK